MVKKYSSVSYVLFSVLIGRVEASKWHGKTVIRKNLVRYLQALKKDTEGFNAQTEVYEDLVKAGVIDPAKVTRSALQNAASISGLMLTTEATVHEIEDDKPAPGGGGHDHGGGMGF